jgi:hypothetical protein
VVLPQNPKRRMLIEASEEEDLCPESSTSR